MFIISKFTNLRQWSGNLRIACVAVFCRSFPVRGGRDGDVQQPSRSVRAVSGAVEMHEERTGRTQRGNLRIPGSVGMYFSGGGAGADWGGS